MNQTESQNNNGEKRNFTDPSESALRSGKGRGILRKIFD